jgi:hypothetical protein
MSGVIYTGGVIGGLATRSSGVWGIGPQGSTVPPAVHAVGGTIVVDGRVVTHTFISTGVFESFSPLNLDYLVVGGGGGGRTGSGSGMGGGGAGAVLTNLPGATIEVEKGSYPVVIAGFSAVNNYGNTTSLNFNTPIVAFGGGKGGSNGFPQFVPIPLTPADYASGGGGYFINNPGGPSAGQVAGPGGGFAGADGIFPIDPTERGGGGGGGAGEAGHVSANKGGRGGDGLETFIRGVPEYFGGGGGGSWDQTPPLQPPSLPALPGKSDGGLGGGGQGGFGPFPGGSGGTPGAANTGGGGGGGINFNTPTAGAGGSGIVIIRYLG